ncbi:PadR family transcriptional regulator [Sphingomonas sp. LM7]|uniref:PadR family transcriptional regulator n=1 Tax=Sphingomonas sp. LM7 TaxID=1938607 RepID=UPI000983A90F|nr:PadR family transcriptional regulator [Sphingomonas sp. LM7]AQR72401.1 PadR family transcriptional regulator [Sphingomonas sp. LM7]
MRFGFHHGPRGGRDCGGGRHGRPGGWGRGFGGGRGGWGMHDGREGGRGGGRGRRMFDGGELRLVLLKLIEEQPRHGYDLIREIEERSGGAYAPSPGVIYPTLTMLEDMALVEARAEGARKAFAITEAGSAELAGKAEEVAALFQRLAELGEQHARTSGGPIRRAMGNLRAVLQERLAGSEVDPETLHEVAAILDEAARKIERL